MNEGGDCMFTHTDRACHADSLSGMIQEDSYDLVDCLLSEENCSCLYYHHHGPVKGKCICIMCSY